MALQETNKLRVYAENGASQSPSTLYTDTQFDSNSERQTGSKPNTVINSKLTNTILKETSTVCAALVDALKQIGADTTEVGINTAVDTLANLMKSILTSQLFRSQLVTVDKGLTIDSNGKIDTVIGSDLKYSNNAITHNNAITAGSIGPSSSSSGWGASIAVPKITYDANGHITAATSNYISVPSKPTYSVVHNVRNNNINASSTGYHSFSTALSTSGSLIIISLRNSNDNRISTAVLRPLDVTRTGGNYVSASGANTTRYANLTFNVSGSTISGVTIDTIQGLSIISIAQEYYTVE